MTTRDELTGDDALAAEYVLGVLPADERDAVANRIAKDQAFARLVEDWEDRLSPLGQAYSEAVPPASVKAALDRRLFAADTPAARSGFWQSLTLWRSVAAALAALLLLLAVPLIRSSLEPEDQTRLIALLSAEGSTVSYVAIYEPAKSAVDLSRVGAAQPGSRDFELWVIAKGDAPVSMGVIPAGETAKIELSDALRARVAQGATLAISDEPKGGSPTGQPTGPVVAAGELRNI